MTYHHKPTVGDAQQAAYYAKIIEDILLFADSRLNDKHHKELEASLMQARGSLHEAACSLLFHTCEHPCIKDIPGENTVSGNISAVGGK